MRYSFVEDDATAANARGFREAAFELELARSSYRPADSPPRQFCNHTRPGPPTKPSKVPPTPGTTVDPTTAKTKLPGLVCLAFIFFEQGEKR
jgi:hypothetical protein